MLEGLERIGVHLPSLIIHLVNFVLLLAFLYVVAYRPVIRAARERAAREEQMERHAAETEALHQESARTRSETLEAAEREAKRLVAAAIAEARARGQAEAQRLVDRGRERIATAQEQALREVVETSQDLVLLAAKKLLGQTLDPAARWELVRSAINEAGDLLAQSGRPAGKLVRVVTTSPLSEDEWQRVTDTLTAKLGPDTVAVPETDTTLLGGARLVAGDIAADASLATRLHALHRHLRNAPPPVPGA